MGRRKVFDGYFGLVDSGWACGLWVDASDHVWAELKRHRQVALTISGVERVQGVVLGIGAHDQRRACKVEALGFGSIRYL